MSKKMKVHFSSDSDEWSTPQDFFDVLNREFKFTLDPCATKKNAKCEKFFTKKDDGLQKSWGDEVVFVNPPYSQLKAWVAKSAESALYFGATVVMLIPSRTDTRAFHNYIWNDQTNRTRPGVEVRFIRGRLKFGGSKNSAPFPSCVVIFWARES
jgi:phage N-6-adenine-methyltransferase